MLNKVLLIGRLGADPEIRYTSDGEPIANFHLATLERWVDKNRELQERIDWHRIVAFGRLANFCADSLKKGKMIFVEGALKNRSYEDQDGNKRYVTEVVARSILILATPQKAGSQNNSQKESKPNQADQENYNYEDDLPF